MSTKTPVKPLRAQITEFLAVRAEATLKQIAAATTERDFPSRVTSELNKMRTDALVECAKKKGKNELWYWLAAPSSAVHDSQPAVEQNTGSSAEGAFATPASGVAVQPQSAPVVAMQGAETTGAADEIENDDEMPPADAALLALANRELSDRLARVAHVLRGSGLEGLKDLDDGADLQSAAAALTGAYQMALAEPAMLRRELAKADADLQKIHTLLAHRVSGAIDPSDIGEVECAEKAAEMIDEALDEISSLVSKLGAARLSGSERCAAAGYLVRAHKRVPRITNKQETAVAAALAAVRNGSARVQVFALVPVGKAVRRAEWRPA